MVSNKNSPYSQKYSYDSNITNENNKNLHCWNFDDQQPIRSDVKIVKKIKTGQGISVLLEKKNALQPQTANPFNDDNHTRRNVNSNNTTSVT